MIGQSDPAPESAQAVVPTPEPAPPATPKPVPAVEFGGRDGPEPTRYGDWEKNGRCIDF
ncbi:MAG: DUF1674 domain-containing protein [Thermomonas sp.]|uniref:DUF1674 domain-containing protein n=1 Tax=Thermomonas sp. TaxID=1971895 RepID=UPI0039E72587